MFTNINSKYFALVDILGWDFKLYQLSLLLAFFQWKTLVEDKTVMVELGESQLPQVSADVGGGDRRQLHHRVQGEQDSIQSRGRRRWDRTRRSRPIWWSQRQQQETWNTKKFYSRVYNSVSSVILGFFNSTPLLWCWDLTSFSMQFENIIVNICNTLSETISKINDWYQTSYILFSD